jgi:hypothetical protein
MNPVPIEDEDDDDMDMPMMSELELPTFWGTEVKPGKATPFVPPPVDASLHVSQVRELNGPMPPSSGHSYAPQITQLMCQ